MLSRESALTAFHSLECALLPLHLAVVYTLLPERSEARRSGGGGGEERRVGGGRRALGVDLSAVKEKERESLSPFLFLSHQRKKTAL